MFESMKNDHRRPAAISASICSISAVGAFSEASLATGSKSASVSIERRTFAHTLQRLGEAKSVFRGVIFSKHCA
jgi:hypothetical protein